MVTEEEVRRQLGDVGTAEISSPVITQAISQATNEVDARKRPGVATVLVADAKVKLSAYYTWSTYIKAGRYELGEIREEGYDIILDKYRDLATAAVNLVSTQAIFLSTDYEAET